MPTPVRRARPPTGTTPTLALVKPTPQPEDKKAPVRRAPIRSKAPAVVKIADKVIPVRDTSRAYQGLGVEISTSGVDHKAVIERYVSKIKNPKTAIRAYCIQCCCGQVREVEKCTVTVCALHEFRMGINPYNKRTAAKLARDNGEAPDDDEDGDE